MKRFTPLSLESKPLSLSWFIEYIALSFAGEQKEKKLTHLPLSLSLLGVSFLIVLRCLKRYIFPAFPRKLKIMVK